MLDNQLTGTGVALITPFLENGEIDFAGLSRSLTHTYSQGRGVDYWVVMGTTGESATLNSKEKNEVLAYIKANNEHGLPLVYGIGGNNTQEVIENIHKTDLAGVKALLSVSPYYNKPSQEGIVAHFTAIADASPIPIILYNVPGRTAANMKADTTLRLAEHPNIIATKEASGDLVQCMEIAKNAPKGFHLISGDDLLTVAMMGFGAKGVISVLANAFPLIFNRLTRYALDNQFQKANQELFKLLEINPLMYEEANPVGVKYCLELLGVCKKFVRLPLLSASDSLQTKISNLIEGLN
jgi:4-hydroxy-tetrahydrodipicolinate synthase